MISFTGSTAVGKMIATKSADTLKRMFLELGGKSAAVMLEDADIDTVIPNMAGVCLHAGQGCGMMTRLLVPHSRLDDAVNRLTEMFEFISPADPALPDTLLGPVINVRQQQRILGYIDRARDAGAEITVGGSVPSELAPVIAGGTYVLPTVVTGIDNSAEIARHEVFGPVLVVLGYDSEDDALRIANDSEYGLSGSVFSASRIVRWPSRARCAPVPCPSMAASTTVAMPRLVDTSRAAWAARTGSKASNSTCKPRS